MSDTETPRKALLATLMAALDEHPNCIRVERDIRGGRPPGGTCWWDDETQRLLDRLPRDACWRCRARHILRLEGQADGR